MEEFPNRDILRERSAPLPGAADAFGRAHRPSEVIRPQSASFVHTNPGTRTRLYSAQQRKSRPRKDLTWHDFDDMCEVPTRRGAGNTGLLGHGDEEAEKEASAVVPLDSGEALVKVLENSTPGGTPPSSERRNRDDLKRVKGVCSIRKVQKFKRSSPLTVMEVRARRPHLEAMRETRISAKAESRGASPALKGAFESEFWAKSAKRESSFATLRLTVKEAMDLPGKLFGTRDPFCAIDIEDHQQRTHVVPSSRHPGWDATFVFQIRSLLSPVFVRVIDRHAEVEHSVMGTLEFRPLDVMIRAGWPRDSDAFSAEAWFVLQDWAGVPAAGNLSLAFDLVGCQNVYVPEFKLELKVVNLDEIATEHVSGAAVPTLRHKRNAEETQNNMDLVQLFEGQKQLDEGCAEGNYPFRSLNLFPKENRFRRVMFKLVTSFAYQTVSWTAAVISCLSMGINAQPVSAGSNMYSTMEFASYVFLAVEIALKCVAFGFVDKASSFLTGSAFNVVDFICVISYWVEFCLPSPYNAEFTLRPFRFFRILLPLTHFEVFTGLTAIFLTLKSAFFSLVVVMYFCFLFFVGFGIFAVTFYHDSFSRRCVTAERGEMIVPERWCKVYESGESSCAEGQVCAEVGNPDGINFDHMGRALVSIFQAISLDGQQDVMNRSIQSEPQFRLFGVFFFLLLTFFCRLLLFNLCVAVVTTTFHKVREKVTIALQAINRLSNKVYPLDPDSESDSESEVGERTDAAGSTFAEGSKLYAAGVAQLSFRDFVFFVVSHPLFELLAMSGVMVNVTALALQHAKMEDGERNMLQWLEVSTQVMFVVELTLRMMGANSLPEFFAHGHDKFDFFVFLLTAMSLFALAMGVTREELGLMGSLSALRFVRLMSLVEDISHLLALALASIPNIMNLLLFSFSFVSVSSVVAMFFFKAREGEGDTAVEDYETYGRAMVTLFQVFSSDMWRLKLYSAMQHGFDTEDPWRTVAPALFLMLFFFVSQAILLNLYIAVIIENFNLANLSRRDSLATQRESVWHYFARGMAAVKGVLVGALGLQGERAKDAPRKLKVDRALGLFTAQHPLRKWATRTAHSSWFGLLIMLTILFSLCALAVEPPARDTPALVPFSVLDAVNWVATMIFLFEFLIQVVRLGFVNGKDTYLHSPWNVCDFVVLILSFMDLLGGDTKQARVLRLGRALRPLRLIKRNQGMRLMVDALISTWRPVIMIVLLAFTVATIFAILGMTLFRGKLGFCSDDHIAYPAGRFECLGTEQAHKGWIRPRAWDVPAQNFDSFPRAMVQFLAMNTFKWVDVMTLATAITEEGKSPLKDNSWHYVAFFVIYVIIGCLFVMNLFVAFIIDGFEQLRKQDFKHLEVLSNYEAFVSLVRKWSPHKNQPKPTSPSRVWIRKSIVETQMFAFVTTMFVYLNVTFMALYSPAVSTPEYERFYQIQNHVFLGLLVVEVALNVAAVGSLNYLHDGWNHIDLASIVASFLAFAFPHSSFVRGLRLIKVFRLIKNVRALKMIFITLARAVPQFASILLLLLIIFTMFAILLVNTCGLTREGDLRLGSPVARWPNSKPNFISYPVAMYSLFLISQGEDWHLLIYDASVQPPFCTEQFDGKEYGDCGNHLLVSAIIFFGFKLVAEYVLLNLLIGMLIDTFVSARNVGVQFYFERGKVDVSQMSLMLSAMNSKEKKKMKRGGVAVKRGSVASVSRQTSGFEGEDAAQGQGEALDMSPGTHRESVANLTMDSTTSQAPPARRTRMLTRTKSCVECWTDVTGGGTEDFILIPDVQVLMRMLPQPLGFARNAFGEPEISRTERAVCKLIWSELNLISMERGYGEPDSRIWRWVTALVGLRRPAPAATNFVTFEETFITLLHWRCPQYVPGDLRVARGPMMEHIVKTAHAVVISRHIRRWLNYAAFREQQTPGRGAVGGGKESPPLVPRTPLNTLQSARRPEESSLRGAKRSDSGSRHTFLSAMTHEIRELGHAVVRQGSNHKLFQGVNAALKEATGAKMSTAVGGLDARFARTGPRHPGEDSGGREEGHRARGRRTSISESTSGAAPRRRRASLS